MSEQIREQVSAFLDGELPAAETELLLKRLTREAALRESFGRYALIGEAMRGAHRSPLGRGFAGRVSAAIDGDAGLPGELSGRARGPRWWRPVAGAAVAAGVTAVALVAFQQRAGSPALRAALPVTAQNTMRPKEALSYTVPAAAQAEATPAMLPAARLTSYVFAHSRYSSMLGESNLLAGLLSEDEATIPADDQGAAAVNAVSRSPANEAAAHDAERDARSAP